MMGSVSARATAGPDQDGTWFYKSITWMRLAPILLKGGNLWRSEVKKEEQRVHMQMRRIIRMEDMK